MFKITIDNKEVITDKDFTIEEEMLNTPSVILNNVYPKEWETEKDYLNFYHPNEYSKCKIYDEEITPASEGSTVEGTDFSITYDDTKEFSLLSLKGETSQTTTTGKNLFNLGNVADSDKNHRLNTSGGYYSETGYFVSNMIKIEPSTTYTISYTPTALTRICYYSSNTTSSFISRNDNQQTFTTPSNAQYLMFCNLMTEMSNIQLEKGSQATSYEPYTYGASPNPNYPQEVQTVSGRQEVSIVGKNLNPTPYANGTTKTTNGITFTVQNDGTVVANGTATATAYFYMHTQDITPYWNLPQGNYTLSGCASGGASNKYYIGMAVYNDTTRITGVNEYGSGANFNTSSLTYNRVLLFISISSGQVCNNLTFKPMVRLANISDNTYEEYKGQTYELDLGKNMLSLTNNQTITSAGITAQVQHGWIILNGTATATSTIRFPIDATIVYADESYTLSANNTSQVSGSGIVLSVGNTADSYTQTNFSSLNAKKTFKKDSATTYNRLTISTASGTTYNNYIIKPQLEKGSKATEYSDYKEPIELNNIDGYQDVIFKNGVDNQIYYDDLEKDTWYLLKRTGKVDLSTITWNSAGHNVTNYRKYYTNTIPNIKYVSSNQIIGSGLAEKYRMAKGSGISNVTDVLAIDVSIVSVTDKSSPTGLFYYALATPETTVIEDTDLLKQLDAISLLNGINYITVSSPNLIAPLKIHYNFSEEIIDQDLYFCGVVKNSGNISLNPREPHFQSLQVLSYKTFLSEGETLDFVIYEKTIKEAIEQVVSAISDYGFIVGDINILNQDEIIGAYSTKDKSAYDVFQYIADITQSRWTTRMIDEDTIAIDFYDPTLMEYGTTIDYTKEFFEENLIDNMFYSYGTNDYRNKQVMTSQQVYSNINQTQNIVANGYQTQFNTEQVIGKINSILVDNVSYSFATNTEKEMGVSADFYYSAGNNYIESASAISVGKVITIDYLPIVEGRQIITNAYEIDRVSNSTGVKGIVARYENRNDATTSTELQLIGQSYIKYKGTPEIVLTVITRKDLWNVGQRVPFNAPINELATEYMVRKKAINRITTIDTIFYTYELTSSFNSETAVNYFDNQRAKANGNIGDGEYISRNIDIESQARIVFYDSSATVITTTGDNKLNCTLESPFVE